MSDPTQTVRIGSLFSGVGGLDMAVEQSFDGRVIWHAETDPDAAKVLAHRFSDVPNLGDVSKIAWHDVPPVDVMCGGFPCQDLSEAGGRAGLRDGTRSGLWACFAAGIAALQPRYVVIENVKGIRSAKAHRNLESGDPDLGTPSVLRTLGAVLGDLCESGYDAKWSTVAAYDVGAPHRRERVFILAELRGAADATKP